MLSNCTKQLYHSENRYMKKKSLDGKLEVRYAKRLLYVLS